MRHPLHVCHFPVWKHGFLAILILAMSAVAAAQETGLHQFAIEPLPLPGANGLVMLDYFAYDHTSRLLWVPAANTGSVDIVETATNHVKRVEGFPVAQVEIKGK